ncbi:hypothetical protein [Paenibacillus solani]|uniref:Lipoprotein n=1 Tax=Paenibacillus solani TaxID=1705565 RepID=A0A0M1P057_9BACL|nr:hypothetical protein [Paenibacillus solani]KOR87868.1 hypothetical protein AM231_01095 [Paenibacillus solani]
MKSLGIAFIIIACLLAGCSQATDVPTQDSAIQVPDSDDSGIEEQQPEAYSLHFKEVELEEPLKSISTTDLTNVINKQKIDEYTIYFYEEKGLDEENVRAAIQIDTKLLEIGQVGYAALDPEQYTVSQVQALDQTYIKVSGACGANCPISYYIHPDISSPISLRIEAHTVEADIDQNGINYIVASVGTAADTSIYKLRDGHIVAANLNETLAAQAVIYDKESNMFGDGTRNWRVKEEELVLFKE